MLVSRSSSAEFGDGSARSLVFSHQGTMEGGEERFDLDFSPELCGRLEYRIRVHPHHPLLTHPLEMGLMVWL
jgi:starch phosphorylase